MRVAQAMIFCVSMLLGGGQAHASLGGLLECLNQKRRAITHAESVRSRGKKLQEKAQEEASADDPSLPRHSDAVAFDEASESMRRAAKRFDRCRQDAEKARPEYRCDNEVAAVNEQIAKMTNDMNQNNTNAQSEHSNAQAAAASGDGALAQSHSQNAKNFTATAERISTAIDTTEQQKQRLISQIDAANRKAQETMRQCESDKRNSEIGEMKYKELAQREKQLASELSEKQQQEAEEAQRQANMTSGEKADEKYDQASEAIERYKEAAAEGDREGMRNAVRDIRKNAIDGSAEHWKQKWEDLVDAGTKERSVQRDIINSRTARASLETHHQNNKLHLAEILDPEASFGQKAIAAGKIANNLDMMRGNMVEIASISGFGEQALADTVKSVGGGMIDSGAFLLNQVGGESYSIADRSLQTWSSTGQSPASQAWGWTKKVSSNVGGFFKQQTQNFSNWIDSDLSFTDRVASVSAFSGGAAGKVSVGGALSAGPFRSPSSQVMSSVASRGPTVLRTINSAYSSAGRVSTGVQGGFSAAQNENEYSRSQQLSSRNLAALESFSPEDVSEGASALKTSKASQFSNESYLAGDR